MEGSGSAWVQQRNASGAKIRWLFDLDKAQSEAGPPLPDSGSL